MNNPIVANDISRIAMFKQLKVYLLKGNAQDKLVIKTDAIQTPQYKSANTIVKAVDHSARVKILSKQEEQALKDYCDSWDDLDSFYADLIRQGLPVKNPFEDSRDAVTNLKQSLTFGFPFVKMEAHNLRDLEGALKDRAAGNKQDLQAFTQTLTEKGGLEKLGHVVAVDLFNGNTDRFFPGTNNNVTIGPYNIHLKALVNVGNVFVVLTGGGFKVSALDFVDPQSRFKDLNQPLANLEASSSKEDQWPGRVLISSSRRSAFASDIVHDLEKILHPKKHALSLKSKLGVFAARRLESGMIAGAQAIRQKLFTKFNGKWTAGAKERYDLLAKVK